MIVDQAQVRKPRMIDALLQFHPVKIAKIDTAIGKRLVELYQLRLIFRADWANSDLATISQHSTLRILAWIWTDSRLGELIRIDTFCVNRHPGVQFNKPICGSESSALCVHEACFYNTARYYAHRANIRLDG